MIKRPKQVERSQKSYLSLERYQDFAEEQFKRIYDYLDEHEQEDYVSEETQIGTWKGKPLYRRIIESTLPATTNTTKTIDTIQDLDTVLNLKAVIGHTNPRNQYWTYQFPIISSDTNSGLYINNNNQINVRWQSSANVWANSPIIVTIEYTKI